MPDYPGGLLSASLSHSADIFRKLYYDNGSHAGCIVYIGAAQVDRESMEKLRKHCKARVVAGRLKICSSTRREVVRMAYRFCRFSKSPQRMSS